MTDNVITRLLPGGSPDGEMKPMGYIADDAVADGIADERGHMFFTNATGNVNVGVWQCTPCTEETRDYPFDQLCFVLEARRPSPTKAAIPRPIRRATHSSSRAVSTASLK